MDYKEQIEQAKRAAVKWREKHPVIGVGEIRVDCMVDDLTRSITDLLARAEAAEYELEQKKGYYDQMVDALAAVDSRELEEAKEKLKAAEARAEKAEMERDAAVSALAREKVCHDCKDGWAKPSTAEKQGERCSDTCERYKAVLKGEQHNG